MKRRTAAVRYDDPEIEERGRHSPSLALTGPDYCLEISAR